MPERYGSWSTVYGRLHLWARAGAVPALMEAVAAGGASRGQADPGLVSVDSTVARAHHHAAGTAVDPGLLQAPEQAAAEERAPARGQNAPVTGRDEQGEAKRAEWRRLRRRHRLRTAEPGRSRGGPTGTVHPAADRRCPLPLPPVRPPTAPAPPPSWPARTRRCAAASSQGTGAAWLVSA